MALKPYRPRLTIEVSEEQLRDLQNLLDWGVRNRMFCYIIDDVIRLLKKHGDFFVAAVCSKDIKLEEWLKGRRE